ncbi:hypothetical protein [Medusavirus stheno T3]|uniref:Uncharacterized protein n=1 Tax=Medusavirus stheno T3 TaxID=3069717 RepID=A0A7S8BD13_9VIRU|nr:hypothetical protein QKU73_gp426 [Acanthamoeba castellanii medusavirus]QPB44349.1 hypothetical protein [Medusavirus stheno T3]
MEPATNEEPLQNTMMDENKKSLRRKAKAPRGGAPGIWAVRLANNGGPLAGDQCAFDVNLFRSEADARRSVARFNFETELREFSSLPHAIKWAKEAAKSDDGSKAAAASAKPEEEHGRVGDSWTNDARMPPIDTVSDEELVCIEVRGARTQERGQHAIIGYEAWFDGERDVSSMSDLPHPTVSRAVLEGCIKALLHCDEKRPNTKAILLSSSSRLPYMAASGMSKGIPKDCRSLADTLRRMCLQRPISVAICDPRAQ